MGLSHTHRIRVRYSDCDPQGHVFNATYFTYFDIAITELFRAAIGSYGAMLEGGVDIVVAEATARFRGSARFDDLVDLEVTVDRLGTTSMLTHLRVLRGGEPLVEGELVHVFVDRSTMTKTEVPTPIRAALAGPRGAGRTAAAGASGATRPAPG